MPITVPLHKSFLRNREAYGRHDDWLDSEPDRLVKYLAQTHLEKEGIGLDYWNERVALLDPDNDIEPTLRIHYTAIAKDEPAWEGFDSDLAQDMLADLTGESQSAWDVLQEVTWYLLGHGFCAAEAFATEAAAETEAQARENNERSFVRLYDPRCVIAWAYWPKTGAGKGKLREVWLKNERVQDGKKEAQLWKRVWQELPGGVYFSQRYKEKDSRADSHLIDTQLQLEAYDPEPRESSTETFPVVFFGHPDSGPKDTTIYRACFKARLQLNKQSHYDLTGRYASFPRHLLVGSEAPKEDAATLSQTMLGAVSGDVRVETLGAADSQMVWRDIQRLRQSIQNDIKMVSDRQTNPESKESPSVEARQHEAQPRINYYHGVTTLLEQGFRRLCEVLRAFEGTLAETAGCKFPRNFQVDTVEIDETKKTRRWMQAGNMGKAGQEIRKQLMIDDLREMELYPPEGQEEDDFRKELEDMIRKEKAPEVGSSPLAMMMAMKRLGSNNGSNEDDGAENAVAA